MKKLLLIFVLVVGQAFPARILFDMTKEEDAGNADWMIDNDFPYPQPPNPSNGDDWIGGISDWGFDLHSMGHEVVTLPPWGRITYNDPTNDLDLSNFDVFVVCEPQVPFSSEEMNAILQYVRNGGALFMVADHNASDRNGNGWDSPHIWNLFEDYFGIHFNVTGDPANSVSDRTFNVSTAPDDPITNGPVGTVHGMSFYAATVMTLRRSINPTLQGHVWKSDASQGTTYVFLATGSYGNGKIAGLTDSSPADDGTGNPGNHLYDGWNESGVQNNYAILNTTLWLASESNDLITVTFTPLSPTPEDSVIVTANYNFLSVADTIFYTFDGTSWVREPSFWSDSSTAKFVIPPTGSPDTVNFFVKAYKVDSGVVLSDTFQYVTGYPSGNLNLENWRLIQENSHIEYIFGNVELPYNSILIIARDASKSDFESFWGVTLSENVVYINSGGSIPKINGGETFTLVNADGDTVDGPTISMARGHAYERVDFNGNASSTGSWSVVDWHDATPGSVEFNGNGNFLGISEMSDADSTHAYIYEFVEIFYGSQSVSVEERQNTFRPLISNIVKNAILFRYPVKNPAVYSANGRRLISANGMTRQIDVSRLAPGVYFLKVDKKFTRFIKY